MPKAHRAFWKRKFERNMERDNLNREELRGLGWRVVEVWEHDVKENPLATVRRIKAYIRESPGARLPVSSARVQT